MGGVSVIAGGNGRVLEIQVGQAGKGICPKHIPQQPGNATARHEGVHGWWRAASQR